MRILINDFIGGVLDRGIPLYVRNLVDGLREEGFQVRVVRAPAFLRGLPRGLFYMLAVAVEQIILPPLGILLRADLTLYPYNSVAIADLFTCRGRIVVHDLECLSSDNLRLVKCFEKGGSGSSGLEIMRPAADAASGGLRLSYA